jgi:hypothetical protein
VPRVSEQAIGRRNKSLGLRDGGRIVDLSPAVTDRATAFFLHQYAFSARTSSDTGISPGVHEHLPILLQQEEPTGALSNIVSAAGLAALANAGTSTPWKLDAYRSYGKALQQLRDDLTDPVRMKSDSTLAAVMLMGTFEVKHFSYLDLYSAFNSNTTGLTLLLDDCKC